MRLPGRQVRLGVIQRLVKTEAPEHVQAFQGCHVFQHGLRLQREPQHGRIRGYYQVFFQVAFVAQVGHAKSLVLVVQVDIEGIVA